MKLLKTLDHSVIEIRVKHDWLILKILIPC